MSVRVMGAFALCAGVTLAEGICVPDPLETSSASGAIYFASEDRPLSGVRVEITEFAYGGRVLASTTTGEEGHFSLPGIHPGRYWLNARHPVVGHFEVELRVFSLLPRKRRLVIVIGADPTKGACLGGYAKATAANGK